MSNWTIGRIDDSARHVGNDESLLEASQALRRFGSRRHVRLSRGHSREAAYSSRRERIGAAAVRTTRLAA